MAKMTYKDRLRFAKKMTSCSKDWREDMLAEWGDDLEMAAASRQDANDLRKIGTLLRTKSANAALDFASSLDTIVRDAIPEEVWQAMLDDEA